jgi:hypothetical protein
VITVPFRSQHDLRGAGPGGAGSDWAPRACAIACLTMVLRHHGCRVEVADVLATALRVARFDPRRGWLHPGLVEVLQTYGLSAYRRNWSLMDGNEVRYLAGRPLTHRTQAEIEQVRRQMRDEGFATICRLLAAGAPVIVSVLRPWGDRSSMGHQIVLLSATTSAVTYHEPAVSDGACQSVPIQVFLDGWKGLAIIGGPQLAQPQ